MLNFAHTIPTKIYFGRGQISHLTEELNRFGKNMLLCYGGGSVKRSGLYDEVTGILGEGGFTVTELGGIDPNPRITSVTEGARLCREKGIDAVLAVGGGSVIDCAKAVCVAAFWDETPDPWAKYLTYTSPAEKALPLVDILTMSATGSEYDNISVISNMELHQKMGRRMTFPAASICDPCYTFSVPAGQTAAGSADIMSHILEGYFSRTFDSDVSEGIAEAVLRSVMRNCPAALHEPDNYSARANLMADSTIACSGVPEYGKQPTGWPCHAMEHELSAFYDITHGTGLAILTPRWMRFILKKDPTVTPRFVRFAKNVMGLSGDDDTALALAGIDALESYFASTGLPMTLGALGIGEEHFGEMAAHSNFGGRLESSYVPLSCEDVEEIFRECL